MSTRSVATLHGISGAKFYINDPDVALQAVYFRSNNSSVDLEHDKDLHYRSEITSAALEAHKLLGKINGQSSHNLGVATNLAKRTMPRHVYQYRPQGRAIGC